MNDKPEHPKTLRERIEDGLGAWAHFVFRFRWLIAIAMLAVTGTLASYIPSIELKMSTEDFLFEDDPARIAYDRFKEEFGQDQVAILTIEPTAVFDLAFLEKLRAFHDDLEDEVPYLEDITSLINARSVYGRGDELVVGDLLDDMPSNQAELDALRERVMSTPSYLTSGMISADGKATTVLVELATYSSIASDDADADLLTGFGDDEAFEGSSLSGEVEPAKRPFLTSAENSKLVETILAIIERHDAPDFKIRAAGSPLLTYQLTLQMSRDVPRFFGGGLLVITFLLVLLFRRTSPVLLCLLVVMPSALSTFGLAAILGIPLSSVSQLVPSFLLAVGVGYAVHLVTIFLRDLSENRSRLESLEHALRHSGLPVMMTALTTAVGVLSFLAAEMKPIADMGLLSALGVAVTLVYAMVFLPALLAILPLKAGKSHETPRLDACLSGLATSAARHPWSMVGGCALLALSALVAMTQLRVAADPTSWFPEDHPYRVASDYITDTFGGSGSLELVIDVGVENGLHEPETMNRIESLDRLVADLRESGAALTHTTSIVDIVKETHQALNANDPAFYAIPQERMLLAQELLLFENAGSDHLEKVVDSRFSKARYSIRSAWHDGADTAKFLEESEHRFHEAVGPDARLLITGISAVISRTVAATTESMLRSYALALALITPLMIILIGSLRAGLISMVPNLVPILLTLGMMALADIPIDMFTLLAGCIAIGLAVDDSIHFIWSFRRYLALGHDPIDAVEKTMQSTGRALLFTSIVLTTGFLVLTLSAMLNLQQVGALTAFAVAAAFLLDVTVTPALLVLTHRKRKAVNTSFGRRN